MCTHNSNDESKTWKGELNDIIMEKLMNKYGEREVWHQPKKGLEFTVKCQETEKKIEKLELSQSTMVLSTEGYN